MMIENFSKVVEIPFKATKFILKSPSLTGQKLLLYILFGKPEIEVKHF